MAFENGFDPREHFEPIVACLKKNPGLEEKILALMDLHMQSAKWPFSVEELLDSLHDLMQDSWAYSCLRQFFLYDENCAREIFDEELPRLEDIEMEQKYKEFFFKLRNTYIPKISKVLSVREKDVQPKN